MDTLSAVLRLLVLLRSSSGKPLRHSFRRCCCGSKNTKGNCNTFKSNLIFVLLAIPLIASQTRTTTSTGSMVAQSQALAALLSTVVISIVPNLLLLLCPSLGGAESVKFLSLGQAVSAGGLLGDVFLHAIPHGCSGVWLLIGFGVFLCTDMLIRSPQPTGQNRASTKENSQERSHLKSVAVINLIADALHNFTDGLAVGTSYTLVKENATFVELLLSRGGLVTVSVLLHEVPHELGDFCTLLRAGYTKKQAILAQFVTAVAAILGTIMALTLSDWHADESLLSLTAGGFLYLAATTLLPEILETEVSLSFRVFQLISFGFGVLCLYGVAILEHDHGHHHHDMKNTHDHHHHRHSHDHIHSEL